MEAKRIYIVQQDYGYCSVAEITPSVSNTINRVYEGATKANAMKVAKALNDAYAHGFKDAVGKYPKYPAMG